MKRVVGATIILSATLFADNVLVKITKDIPYIDIKDSGVNVRISRIQDTANKLTDDFAKTSRPCPPHCIQKIKPIEGVKTISEIELIDFIKNKVYKKKGILADARIKEMFLYETIPGAINIPFTITQVKSKKVTDSLFKALGAKVKDDGSYDFSNAKELAVFCNGVWCGSSVKFIKNMIAKGYPKEKLYYYRGGLQSWKLLGLTTVVHKSLKVDK
jgi:rhodanese-related sulfurtransferase